jgi:hypothetical protein
MGIRESITWEQAVARFPLALTRCEVDLSGYTLYWSHPSLRSTEVDGIFASCVGKDPYLYYQGAWKRL